LQQQSPKQIMQKGWLLALKDSKLVRSVNELLPGDRVELVLHDGSAQTQIETLKPESK